MTRNRRNEELWKRNLFFKDIFKGRFKKHFTELKNDN
jgi:hypothetical protein